MGPREVVIMLAGGVTPHSKLAPFKIIAAATVAVMTFSLRLTQLLIRLLPPPLRGRSLKQTVYITGT